MENYFFKSKIDICFGHVVSGDHVLKSSDGESLNVIVMNGANGCRVSVNGNQMAYLAPYTLFLAGKESIVTLSVPEGGSAILLYFDYIGKYCDAKICAFLESSGREFSNSTSIMPMNEGLKGYFLAMDSSLVELFGEVAFREIKYKEFFYILCNWLEISDFTEFLHPAMSWYDPVFRRLVLDNYQKSYRVKALAKDCGYSEKEFVVKFRKEFGMMPGKWITEQVCGIILKSLSNPNASFKLIAEDLQMSSVQSFTRYCRRNFGKTPSQLKAELKKD